MEFIDYHLLHDMHLQGVEFTWTNRRSGKDIIQVRLDRALISNDLCYRIRLEKAGSGLGSDSDPDPRMDP